MCRLVPIFGRIRTARSVDLQICFFFEVDVFNYEMVGCLAKRPTIPSLKLTYPLKIDHWKRRFLLKTIILRGYVSFRECNQ